MRTVFFILLMAMLANTVTVQAQGLDNSKEAFAVRGLFPNYLWPLESIDKLEGEHFTRGLEFEYYRHLNNNLSLSFPLRLKGVDVPLNDAGDIDRTSALALDVMLNANLTNRNATFVPMLFAGVGAGVYDLKDPTTSVEIPLGLALNIRISKGALLSLKGEYSISPDDYRNHLQIGTGLLFMGDGGSKTPPITDRDNDGINDNEDLCPDTFGIAAFNGCPDTDGDGVADSADDCPEVAGLAAFNGCPDSDADGVADSDDACPNEAGPVSNKGCPVTDRDGDGIDDANDRCPDLAGVASANGCPDRDGDSVADSDDDCPNQAGTATNGGCPDTDNDGLVDRLDSCPNEAGPVANKGCPELAEEDKETLEFAVQAVEFETGSAQLTSASKLIVNDIADIMRRYPAHKLAIGGHTDSIGSAEDNQSLSERRAKACYDYLVAQGIDGRRMSHAGYGETQPIADNRYKPGRDKNRRVEFDLYIE